MSTDKVSKQTDKKPPVPPVTTPAPRAPYPEKGRVFRWGPCTRCGHEWYPGKFDERGIPVKPKSCSACHSAYWSEPRQRAPKTPRAAMAAVKAASKSAAAAASSIPASFTPTLPIGVGEAIPAPPGLRRPQLARPLAEDELAPENVLARGGGK